MVRIGYDWAWKMSGYLIFVSTVLQIIPGEKERKYIHFFTGLMFVLMIVSPIMRVFSCEDCLDDFNKQYEIIEEQVEKVLEQNLDDEKGGKAGGIQVEEIRIGNEGVVP